ncbi:MAG: PAS domain-containing protein [Actinomycetota bacterium]|nr:PAS domain-containing protein [Actinomycetota bacterium]
MADTAQTEAGDDVRHAVVLEAVAFAAERLLLASDWREAADEVLERMGSAASVSRAYILENLLDEAGSLIGTTRHEWRSAGIDPGPASRADDTSDGERIERWAALLARGEPVVSHVADLPHDERGGFEALGIISIAEYPIFVGDEWWGSIGFDDRVRGRGWGSELDALRAAATVVGAAVTRRRIEDERRKAEERWLQVIERIPAVTYNDVVLSPGDVRIGFMSPQIRTVLGYEPERFIEEPAFWFSVTHPEDLARLEASGVLEATNISTFDEVYRMRAADGSYRWIHDTSTPVLTDEGELDHFLGFMLDVTERMQAQEQVRQAEERYRFLVEQTPAITYTEALTEAYEHDAVISFLSPQVEAILGYPIAAWGEPGFWLKVLHPDDRDAVMAESIRTNATREKYRQEYRMVAADGRVVWFQDESVIVHDSSGAPLYWQGVIVDITERKLTEQQLRQAEERFRTLVEHIPAVVYAEPIEFDPGLLYLSPQVEWMLGWTAEEWQADPAFWFEHLHPDDLERVRELNTAANTSKDPFASEYRMLHKDGHYVWIYDEAVVVTDDTGAPLFWQGVLLDITARKRAERGLAEAERRHRAVIEHIPAVVYRESPEGDPAKFYISPQVIDIFGYTPDEWTWTPDFWRDGIHPDDRPHVIEVDERSNESKEAYALDYRFRHADGHWIWVQDEATFVPEAEGEGFWQGFLVDITKRKVAEEQLREAELKFRTIVEQNQAIFYTQEIDPNDPSISLTTYIAPGNTDLVGYTSEEIQANPSLWRSIIHPDDRDRVLDADAASNVGGDAHFSMEYRMIGKDGSVVWVQDEARRVELPGKQPYWQGFLLDVTERKVAQAQLERALTVEREAARRLRSLDEMKNTFLQAVSHDLRTPLAAILGLAITLERGEVQLDDADARDLARRIAGNARRLDRLVTNLLDMDRLARGIVTPQLEVTDVGAVVARVVEESELVPHDRLETDLERVVQPVDVAKLERVVENLLANAVRHAPTSVTVWISVKAEAGGVVIMVEDDGPGVPDALRETIFQPFRQGPDAPKHSPGVGVGLTLVRRFAELQGGRAWVQDRVGGGASFRVFLPADAAESQPLLPPADPEPSHGDFGLLPPADLP